MIHLAFPVFEDKRSRSPQYHQRANRLALELFALTLLVGLTLTFWA